MSSALFERHRPRCWAEIVGQSKAIAVIDCVRRISGSVGGHCWFLSGSSGTGKTTIARLLAAEIAEPFAIDELGAAELNADYLRSITAKYAGRPLGGRGWAVIVNEVHTLRHGQIDDLLTLTEPAGGLPSWFVWVFTTTSDGEKSLFDDYADAGPFASRCKVVPLARRDLAKPFAELARKIAQEHGLDGQPPERYVRLLHDCRGNMREALQRIESGEMLQ